MQTIDQDVAKASQQDSREGRIEWLRFGSAMLVVVCHFAALYASYFHSFDVDSATTEASPSKITTALTALYFQFHGAYIFFAISGYVIAKPWLERLQVPSHHEFFQRRAFRLLPAATLAIVATAYFDFYHLEHRNIEAPTLLLNLVYLNWLAPTSTPPILIVTWTLAVEWLFYLAAPLLVGFLIRQQRPLLSLIVLTLLSSAVLRSITANAYAYPLYFAVGIAIAIQRTSSHVYHPNRTYSWQLLVSGCVTILLASLLYSAQAPINWRPVQWEWRPFDTFVLLHLAGTTALLYWASSPATKSAKVPNIAPKLPKLTYSIYLWHLQASILLFAVVSTIATPQTSLPETVRLLSLLALALLLTLALAWLSYLIAERPYFHWRRRQLPQ